MTWSVRHEGSPRAVKDLTLAQVITGLRDGVWAPTDEVVGPGDKKWVAIEAHPQLQAVAEEIEPPPPRVHPDETRLDMNALIDVCLVLLIFFILTTTYTALAKVVPVPVTTDSQEGQIRVVKKGQVENYMIKVVAREGADKKPVIAVETDPPVGLDEFPAELQKWVRLTKRHEMLLDVSGLTWGQTIKIQDVAKAAGINKINYLMGKK